MIKEMHYDFKMKLNKIDSNQYRNLQVPEIDWILNSALRLFVKMIAFPRQNSLLGFEVKQRNTDDIRNLLVKETIIVDNNLATLPNNYWHYISSEATISKESCIRVKSKVVIRQHDDNFKNSFFDKSSFEWREVNATFIGDKIEFFPTDFIVNDLDLKFIREPLYIHNAEDFRNGVYSDLKGNVLSGKQDSELPYHTQDEIVDIAVLLATNAIQIPDYQNKLNKLKINLN